MPLPTRRRSKSKKGKRRTHWTLNPTGFNLCPECQEPKLPHHVCPQCGSYKGRRVVEAKEA